jgi:alpha-galactosidase
MGSQQICSFEPQSKDDPSLSSSKKTSAISSLSRRAFLERSAGAGVAALALPGSAVAQSQKTMPPHRGYADTYFEFLRPPDHVTAYCGLSDPFSLVRADNNERWSGRSVTVTTRASSATTGAELSIGISAPKDALTHVHLRWALPVASSLLLLGDAWERSYGELAWRSIVPERVMPWYFATWDGAATHGYGVKTGARAMCFWQTDPEGVSLWLDVSNGGSGVLLGERTLAAATVVARRGKSGEDAITAIRQFCRRMCENPRPSLGPVYGSNDWYYAYGNSSPEAILRDADLVAELRPAGAPKPFTVIDEGWENKAKFPDMAALAAAIKAKGVRPGMWERPLRVPAGTNPDLLLPAARFGERTKRAEEPALDPTIPEALAIVTEKMRTIRNWGYELLKHDFSTYDLLGQWGFEMGASPTLPGWSFHDRSKTNAEIILNLYQAIREATGNEMVVLSCNVVGQLGAGIFDMQRTGDDTSGKLWERTRRMGVNTLAFRLPQHGSFFALDADCVAITQAVAWQQTRQWLEVVAASGTALFVSPEAAATGSEQRQALKAAFATVTQPDAASVPLDWMENTTPERWSNSPHKDEKRYRWCEPDGAWPFYI